MTDYSNMTQNDYWHDFNVKAVGRERARNNPNLSAAAACSDYRRKNRALPENTGKGNSDEVFVLRPGNFYLVPVFVLFV